jgi:hypothetical protein
MKVLKTSCSWYVCPSNNNDVCKILTRSLPQVHILVAKVNESKDILEEEKKRLAGRAEAAMTKANSAFNAPTEPTYETDDEDEDEDDA